MKVSLFKQDNTSRLIRCGFVAVGLFVSVGVPTACGAEPEAGESAAPFVTKLENSIRNLADLRETIAAEKIPLAESLSKAEDDLSSAKKESEETRRKLDKLALDVSTLRTSVNAREQEKTYISSLLGEYNRNLETRLHIAEVEKYSPDLEAGRLALENNTLTDEARFEKQFKILTISITRLEDLLGGVVFEGRAAGPDGLVKPGKYVFLGPLAYFRSGDGTLSGIVEQKLGSMEPSVVEYLDPALTAMTAQFVANGSGNTPVDGSLGNARKIEETKETISEHIRKGGPVMYPILGLALIVALVILFKFLELSMVIMPSSKKLESLYLAIRTGDKAQARTLTSGIRGMAGAMLTAGIVHLDDSRELIEEAMYEKMLGIRFRLNRFIPIIAVGASCEPLLGLLGTVTGIINTFRMLTVFGSGDVKQLSGGISEALITTEFGLVIAIPALLCHAFLSRKARGLLDKLEHISISVMSEVERERSRKE